MTSTTVSQHTTQPLNFGPEWLRVLSTPDSAGSIPSSSGSGNVFKFSTTKYRYSKDEILALRVNVSERLSDDLKNEIMENLKDVESVFRADILEPLSLTAPTAEELTKMNALSSYISGRTPGGAGRAGNNSQQSHQDSRNNRGGNSSSNGRGGSSRGRGGRDTNYGSNRGNNNNNNNNYSDENIENGNGADETSAQSSSWSRASHHSRGGSFGNRVRSFDDRDQPQTFRRGTSRQTSDGWRRSRGDDDDNNNEQGEDSSASINGSSSWTTRSGLSRRGANHNSMEQRTKSNEKWSHNDDRTGSSSNFESNQSRSGGWRTNSSISDRDLNSRRPQIKRDRMPEWMDDNNDDDHHLSNATFEQDGTFTRSSTVRQDNDSELQKPQSQSTSDETSSQSNTVSTRQEEPKPTIVKNETSIQQIDTAIVNVSTTSEPIASTVSQSKPIVQQTIPSWDDDFDHSDVAKTVVEATLAEDHDYSPPVSAKATSRLISMESNSIPASIIPQSQQRAPVIIDDKQWYYKDPQNTIQGPFPSADMERWFLAGYFTGNLPVKRLGDIQFSTIQQLTNELGRSPFRTDIPTLPNTSIQKQQSIVSESQKFNSMNYAPSSMSNNPFLDDFSMLQQQKQQQQQQQSRQNVQQSMPFNRQTSMPLSNNDRKLLPTSSSMSSQLQAYFHSQQQQQQQQQSSSSSSPLFSSNLPQDPAIIYQQQLQRSISSTNQLPESMYLLPDDVRRPFRHHSSQSASVNNSLFFPTNVSISQQQQQQQTNDIMTRLNQAMQTHGKERRIEQQRQEFELERLKLYQPAEQARLQRDEEERRKYQLEQELANNRQSNLDQLTKSMESKKKSSMEMDPLLAFQQSIQQAKIEALQEENIRRYQQQYREQANMYPNNWTRSSSQNNEMKTSLNFADIQEQEQERRSRESAAFVHQYGKSESLPMPNSSSSSSSINKSNSWARTLFAGNNNGHSHIPSTSSHTLSDHDPNEKLLRDSSSSTSYNQQATNAPKSRLTTATHQSSTPWNGSANTSFQDIQRQQQIHSSMSTTGWGNPPTGIAWDNPQSSNDPPKQITPWMELKPTSSPTTSKVSNEPSKDSFINNRTQDALSKWTQNQLKDYSKDIDVPTLVQLLKDIDNPGDIMEYVQPYIRSVSKAKEFANDFLAKRNQLANAEPDLDNERLNQLVMAPISSNDNNASGIDEGFQLASSNGQKKKAKKMKGHKIDSKQLGFIVNNRPEQRDDIDQVPI